MNIEQVKLDLEKEWGHDPLFQKTLQLVTRLHSKQWRDGGEPYLNHLLRVAWRVSQMGLDIVIVALLHDCVEDHHITIDELRAFGYDESTLDSVFDLTRDKNKENYCQFIVRISLCGRFASIAVKVADLEDNMMDGKEGARLDKYRLSHYILNGKLTEETRKM